MEKGDIGQGVSQSNVVTLVPTLAFTAEMRQWKRSFGITRRAQKISDESHIVMSMVAWMQNTGYLYNVPFEVWYIGPDVEVHRQVFGHLVERLEPLLGRVVSYWVHYNEEDAQQVLLGSPHLGTIYDADHKRLERRWRLRGYRVPLGGNP